MLRQCGLALAMWKTRRSCCHNTGSRVATGKPSSLTVISSADPTASTSDRSSASSIVLNGGVYISHLLEGLDGREPRVPAGVAIVCRTGAAALCPDARGHDEEYAEHRDGVRHLVQDQVPDD